MANDKNSKMSTFTQNAVDMGVKKDKEKTDAPQPKLTPKYK